MILVSIFLDKEFVDSNVLIYILIRKMKIYCYLVFLSLKYCKLNIALTVQNYNFFLKKTKISKRKLNILTNILHIIYYSRCRNMCRYLFFPLFF